MEHEIAAVEQKVKIEVEEVKVETAEIDSGSFGVEQNTWGLAVKDDNDEKPDGIGLCRIKNDHNFVDAWSKEEVIEMPGGKIKVEEDLECKQFEATYITEEVIIKNENNCDGFLDANTEIVLNSALKRKIQKRQRQKASRGSYSCYNCNYKACHKYLLINHMRKHMNLKSTYLHGSKDSNFSICIHCNVTFKNKVNLDEHTIRKHPDFIQSVSRKMHECTFCKYKTVLKSSFARHLLKHREPDNSYKLRMCIHCNVTFKSKQNLDEHIIRKHPNFVTSVSKKVHECTHCSYKTSIRSNFARHMLKHPEAADSYKLSRCIYCEATFKSKRSLDEHTVRKHPDSVASISRKIHECTQCAYKTNLKRYLAHHLLTHLETADSSKRRTCIYCNATFKRKPNLDEHIIRKHPEFVASVSSKIHQCTHCTYKTTFTTNFATHLLKHPETEDSYKLSMCIHCNMTFKSKRYLDEHTIRKHPDYMSSVSRKIHECTHCTYKTTSKTNFDRHMLKHPQTVDRYMLSTCLHCNKTFKRKTMLDDHTIRKHPNFIASVSSKIHECTQCTYKTTMKSHFARHTC